jgi:hypothetical protein
MLSGIDEKTVADCDRSGFHEEPFAAEVSAIGNWQSAISQKGECTLRREAPASCQLPFANCWFTLPPGS